MKSWFGYGLHLIADTRYQIPVALKVTKASASEPVVLSQMIRGLFAKDRDLADRCSDFSADRGLDGGPLKQALWDEYGIRPLIDTRAMWREEKALALGHVLEGRPVQMRSLVGAVPFADTG